MSTRYVLQICAATCRGGKEINEDCIYAYYKKYPIEDDSNIPEIYNKTVSTSRAIFAIADGISMGGGGKIASHGAIDALKSKSLNIRNQPPQAYIALLLDGMNKKTGARLKEAGVPLGGTTISALYIHKNGYLASNIGDSPIYLFRNRLLSPIYQPHTLAALKKEHGITRITEADENTLCRYLGAPHSAASEQAHYAESTLQENDTFLLCSDGITKIYSDDELREFLSVSMDAKGLIAKRINRATDNLSVIIVRVIGIG